MRIPKRRRRKNQGKDEASQPIGLTDKQVLAIANSTLSQHLALSTEGKQYQSQDIYHWHFQNNPWSQVIATNVATVRLKMRSTIRTVARKPSASDR